MGETIFTREKLLRISSEMAQAGGMEQEERVKNKVDFWTHLYKGS